MIPAVTGKILWVNLTTGLWAEEDVPEQVYRDFLAGLGLAAYYLYQRIPAGADSLGPDNVLAFVSGLLTGTGSLLTGRWMAAAKSPLTGTWGDANCGGTLAPAIKQCGYDGIFFTGISPRPVYLYVGHGQIELRDAADLWGKDTRETEAALQAAHTGKTLSVACIGPAGEKRSLISGIANDGGRLAARSGLGAVMGAKQLKAVALQGMYAIPVAQPAEMKRLTERFSRVATLQPPFLNGIATRLLATALRIMPLQMRQDGFLYKFFLAKYGTSGLNQYSIETGDAPIRNWAGTNEDFPPPRSASVNPDHIRARETVKYHCYACPIGCGGLTRFAGGHAETHKPEYETILALGGLLLNEDLESIFAANEMLNQAGMDSISAGGTVAFAIECYENGLLGPQDTGGLALTWGNSAAILALLDLMIRREGIGDLLADGSRAAAARIGQAPSTWPRAVTHAACSATRHENVIARSVFCDEAISSDAGDCFGPNDGPRNDAPTAILSAGAERFAVQAGGQELAMHDSRNDPGFALHAVVDPTPGRHTVGAYLYYEMFQLWRRIKSLPRVRPRFYSKRSKYVADREKAAWAAACSQFTALLNGAGGCLFGAFLGVQRFPIFEWLNAATGWARSPEEYLRVGWNIQSVRQAFNAREELALSHAINPRALGRPPLLQGANRGASVPIEELTGLYWEAIGWDAATGRPPAADLAALGLNVAWTEGEP